MVTTLFTLAAATDIARLQAAPQLVPSAQAQPSPAPQGAAPEQSEPAPLPDAPAPKENPGLLHELGKLLEKPASMLPDLKSPGEVIDGFNARAKDAAKDTTDVLSRLTRSSMVTGRIACPLSANGAPDCKAAADKLCQSKDFKEGKSLNTDAVEKCSAKVYIPGRKREPGDCRTDSFVTRALCQ